MKKLILAVILSMFVALGANAAWCPVEEYEYVGLDAFECQAYCGNPLTYIGDGVYCDRQINCTPECDCQIETCKCQQVNHKFVYGKGCGCDAGFYGLIGSLQCDACPGGGTSSPGTNTSVTDCFLDANLVHNASVHAMVYETCFYDGSSYSICTVSSIVSCDVGYYQASIFDNYCSPVGLQYYSVYPKDRAVCPTYTNPGGGSSYGNTTGSGAGASVITNCAIPGWENWTDASGGYSRPGCNYSL